MKILNTYVSKFNIVLLVANITIIGALFFNNSRVVQEKDLNYQTNTDEFIRKELGFTDDQYVEYLKLNKAAITGYKRNEELTCINHYHFLLELSKENPSRSKIDSLCRLNGRLHTGLKVFTARHFLNIKSICTPEQEIKLQELIKEMLHIGTCSVCKDSTCPHKVDKKEII